MLLEFSIVPLGTGESVSEIVSKVIETVDKSGLPYRSNPMGTVIEGEWDELMNVVRQCHLDVLRISPRVLTRISIDDRPGKTGRITGKLESVEKHLGKTVRK